MRFSDDEIHKIAFIWNNLFKITSLDREGWDENFIYKSYVMSQFMPTFGFFNDTDFNLKDRGVIIQSNTFSL